MLKKRGEAVAAIIGIFLLTTTFVPASSAQDECINYDGEEQNASVYWCALPGDPDSPQDDDPCVGVSLMPPAVGVGQCGTAGAATSGGTFSSEALGEDLDVTVSWDVSASNVDPADIDHIEVLRGESPQTLSVISSVDATETSYVDTGALALAPTDAWYQVQAVLDDGSVVADDPIIVSGYQTT